MTPQEETVILEARDILGRYLSQNLVIGSWQALMDYCALTVRGPIERFHVLYLDRRNRILSDELLSTGTVDHVTLARMGSSAPGEPARANSARPNFRKKRTRATSPAS